MVLNNVKVFNDQLDSVIRKYPNLKIIKNEEECFIKGVLDIPDDYKNIVGSFLVEIHNVSGFPYRFPELFEIGGDIPREDDWHKSKKDLCCITVTADEIIKCKNGISVLNFIDVYACGYFANQIHRKITGKYKNGEFGHGLSGVIQFYEHLFQTKDKYVWLDYFKYTFRNQKVPSERNHSCFCGSNKKYKNCHLEVFRTTKLIGEEQIIKDFKLFAA